MAPTDQDSDVASSVNNLSLKTTKGTKKAIKKKAKKVVADSWEDEDVSESDPEPEPEAVVKEEQPAAPPPTPLSPVGASWSAPLGSSSSPSPRDPEDASARRPEKTDAVARRMIAAGLGLKAPKQTEEQRAYQKSIREQEKKRREQEKLAEQKAKEDAEKAKAAVWDD